MKPFTHQFEGAEVLDGLLSLAGSSQDTRAVAAAMKEAIAAGERPQAVVPRLFEAEPRFPSPEIARKLFQNLLGLWDLLEAGRPVRLDGPPPPRPKKAKPEPPPPFAPGEPDDGFVEAAWRYLDEDARARRRLMDAFENRQDALLGALDDSGLSDEGYAVVRHLLFELHAMLELGWPKGLSPVHPKALDARAPDAPPVPSSLATYASEALYEVEHDEERPLSPTELAQARAWTERALAALWSARKD